MKSIKENYKNPMFSDGYISVADILLVLAKNLKLILLLPILLVVVALIYAFFFLNLYINLHRRLCLHQQVAVFLKLLV